MNKFLHFGCWNNTNTKKGNILGNMLQVMTAIKKYISLEVIKPGFIVIAGDNYYPEKIKPTEFEKKKKIIHTQQLIDGFKSLPEGIEIDMILGNHDLETNLKKPSLYVDNDTNIEKGDCYILNSEENVEKIIQKEGKNLNLFLFKAKMLPSGTLLLMIDTSMYSIDADKYLICYNHILKKENKNTITLISELINMQNEFILSTITRYLTQIKNIIIIGHHPIIGIKYKENIELLDDIPFFINTINNINQIVKPVNNLVTYYYLCADLHLYQSGIIHINDKDNEIIIHQYIVGTGGTELDNRIPNKFLNEQYERKTLEDKIIKYSIIESICDFGFLECIIEDVPLFRFIKTASLNSNIIGGKLNCKTKKTKKQTTIKQKNKRRLNKKTKTNKKSKFKFK